MISSELPEVLGMADRIVVLFEGRVSRAFTRAEADEDAIMRAATGLVEDGRVTVVAEAPHGRRRSRGAELALASPSSCFRFRELGIVLALVHRRRS